MRVFVALNLPAAQRAHLHQALDTLRSSVQPLRWMACDSLHLTLKFLGDIDGSEISRIEDTLNTLVPQYPPLELQVGGVGAFPSLRRTSVLWFGVQPDRQLMRLQAELELAFSRLGYARETRPFRPHITVARTRSGSRPPDVEKLAAGIDAAAASVVDSVELLRSHPEPAGSRYETLLRVRLAAREGAA